MKKSITGTNNGGWVKLYRKVQESDLYRNLNSKQRDVMIQVLLMANHESHEWMWQGEIFKCEPGQFVTSLDSIKEKCAKDVTIQNIRTSLQILEKWHFLTNQSTKTGRIISIIKWAEYQTDEIKLTNKLTDNQQTVNKQLTPNKKDKNDKEYIRTLELTSEELKTLQVNYPTINVNSEYQSAKDWLLSTGKKYKDYAAFFRNWLRRSKPSTKSQPQYTWKPEYDNPKYVPVNDTNLKRIREEIKQKAIGELPKMGKG